MVNYAKSHAAEDKKKRELIDTRNQADQIIYQTEKQLKEAGDKIDSDTKNKLDAGIGRLREAVKGENVQEMKSSIEALTQILHQAASKMYEATSAAGAGAQSGPSAEAGQNEGEKKPEAEEADFEVVDDKK